MKNDQSPTNEEQPNEKPLLTMAEIAAACTPDRLMVRKCVGCLTFEVNPYECARCYAQLYPRCGYGD